MKNSIVVQTKNLTKFFKDTKAIKNLNLKLKKGEILGLIGPNGSGKTTAIKLILGIYKKTKGDIRIFGKIPDYEDENLRRKIAYIPDEPVFYEKLTGRELLEFSASIIGMSRFTLQKKVNYFLKNFYPIGGILDNLIESYSRGNKQKLGFILQLIKDPELILIDEPFEGLDHNSRINTLNLLKELKSKNIAILIASHSLLLVERICDNVILLKNGETIFYDSIENLRKKFKEKNLEQIYLKIYGKN